MWIDHTVRFQNRMRQEGKNDIEDIDQNHKPDEMPENESVSFNPYEHHRCHHEGAVTQVAARDDDTIGDGQGIDIPHETADQQNERDVGVKMGTPAWCRERCEIKWE
ncbi:hypothetical protein D3C71_1428740 [compost metagenome]